MAGVDLTRIDGISAGTARVVILTEAGLDLSAFPSEEHFASWLRLVPRTTVSGGKPLRHKKTGAPGPPASPESCAWRPSPCNALTRASGVAFRRTARYKGGAVAIFAIARKLAVLVYRMLRSMARTTSTSGKRSTRPGSANAASTACATLHRPWDIH